MKRLLLALVTLALTSCTSEPTKPAENPQPKAPEKTTGSSALFKCYIGARGWAQDAQPYRAESQVDDNKGRDGKAVTWWVGFASPGRAGIKGYILSNGETTPEVEDTYSPANSSTHVFNIQFLKIDTDKAFQVAQEHGGSKLLEQEADTPILYRLEWSQQDNALEWHVIYGRDRNSAKLRVAVDASSGDFKRVEK